MIRQTIVQNSRQLARSSRLFSTSVRAMAEGDTGAPKSGGAAQSDVWSTKEKANEDQYVKQQELTKLKALQKKLQDERRNIENLQKDLDSMVSETEKKG